MCVDHDERPTHLSALPYDELEARHFCAWARREALLELTPDERRDATFWTHRYSSRKDFASGKMKSQSRLRA